MVKGSIVQVDLITCFQSQSNRPPETLNTHSWIHREMSPRIPNPRDRVAEIA
jgi:hypothetical protein